VSRNLLSPGERKTASWPPLTREQQVLAEKYVRMAYGYTEKKLGWLKQAIGRDEIGGYSQLFLCEAASVFDPQYISPQGTKVVFSTFLYCHLHNRFSTLIKEYNLNLSKLSKSNLKKRRIRLFVPEDRSYEDFEHRRFAKRVIKRVIKKLTEKERAIIEKRYGLFGCQEASLAEAGREFGFTRERARQMHNRAIKKMQDEVKVMYEMGHLRNSETPSP